MIVYELDANGFYLSQKNVDDSYKLLTGETTVFLPSADFVKPKFVSPSWVEGATADELLSMHRANKIAELQVSYSQALSNGFTSSALGTDHTYPGDSEAIANFSIVVLRFLTDPSYTTTQFKTLDAGFLPHTKAQFFQAFAKGHDFGVEQDTHYNRLKQMVAACSTSDQVDQINWNTPPSTPSGLKTTGETGAVALSWTANTEIDLVGYNVFQNGTKINTAIVPTNSYVVTNLSSGTYNFTVSAVDLNGNESAQCQPVSGWDI